MLLTCPTLPNSWALLLSTPCVSLHGFPSPQVICPQEAAAASLTLLFPSPAGAAVFRSLPPSLVWLFKPMDGSEALAFPGFSLPAAWRPDAESASVSRFTGTAGALLQAGLSRGLVAEDRVVVLHLWQPRTQTICAGLPRPSRIQQSFGDAKDQGMGGMGRADVCLWRAQCWLGPAVGVPDGRCWARGPGAATTELTHTPAFGTGRAWRSW